MRWDRLLWGVEFTVWRAGVAPTLIGNIWAIDQGGAEYPGEPTRALLFCSRKHARRWCADTMQGWREKSAPGGVLRKWRVRPVRVRETVKVVP